LEVKVIFKIFLPRAKKIALGKEICAECLFLCREFFLFALGKEVTLTSIFSLPGVFYFALGKAFFAESFLFDSRQRCEL
jgi:hypothetical protein